MFKKNVCMGFVIFSGCSMQAGLESLIKGQSYVVDGACVTENEALKLCQVLPARSQAALSTLGTFEEAMQHASSLLPYESGIKKQEVLCLWNSLCDLEAFDSGTRVARSSETSIVASALVHAKVIRDFSKEQEEEQDVASQMKACSCVDVHTASGQAPAVRDIGTCKRPTLTRFRESTLFLSTLSLLAGRVRTAIPEIDTLTRGQLTKKLLSDFTESPAAE